MKTLFLLIVGFISLAHGELFVGEVNKPLEFDIKTAGYYKVELEGRILLNTVYGGEWNATLSTIIDSVPVENPTFHLNIESTGYVNPEESKSDIRRFEVGHHTISGKISISGAYPERVTSTSRSNWKYTVKSAEEIDYRNAIGELQQSLDKRGTDIAAVKNDIATLQAALADQNKGLSEQIDSLKKQADQASQDATVQSNQHTDSVLSSIHSSEQNLNDTANQNKAAVVSEMHHSKKQLSNSATKNTAAILSAINGVSQQVSGVSSQVTGVNNNVTTGNKQNQTLGIIGISLGAAGIGAGVGIPLMMNHHEEENSDVSSSFDSDKESINYVSPGKGD